MNTTDTQQTANATRATLRTFSALLCVIVIAVSACSRPFPDDDLTAVTLLGAFTTPTTATGAVAIKKVFLSNAQPGGNMGGITGADALCNADANKPDSSTYRAMIVDGVNRTACVNANCSPTNGGDGFGWVFQANTTYYRQNGATYEDVLTTNANRIATFPLTVNGFNSSNTNEYWTGLEVDWTVAFAGSDLDCANWTGGTIAQTGSGGAATTDAISFASPSCAVTGTYHLICVEQ